MDQDPTAPGGPSRADSRETFDFEDSSAGLARPPVSSRRSSGNRRQGGTVASTGLNLWSTITLPVRLVVGLLSGTWYFLSKLPRYQARIDGSLDIHANFIPSIHASIPSSSLFRSHTAATPRSNYCISFLCQGLGAVYRLLCSYWIYAGLLDRTIPRVLIGREETGQDRVGLTGV
jgi:hypothetical protein